MKEAKSERELEQEKTHARRLSIKEGIFWTIRQSFGGNYVAPFAIFAGTSSPLVAILNSFWQISSATQILGADLSKKFKRKKILSKTITIESFGWLILAITGFLYLKSIYTSLIPALILISFAIIMTAGGIGYPAWFSWMGDLVDKEYRGRYFSKRNTIISFTTVILTIVGATILEKFKSSGREDVGFILFFLVAFASRLYCASIIKKHYEPKKKAKVTSYKWKSFLKDIKTSNFGKFSLFRGIYAFSMGLTTPLIAIYLLRILEFNYLDYILITLSGTIFSIITLNLWGKIADRIGNYRVLAITSLLIPLVPFLWMFSTSKIYLFLIPGLIGGTSWTAFLLASGNFIYDNVPKEKRPKAISYFSLLIGGGAILGGFVSAGLLELIPPINLFGETIIPIFSILTLGGIARMITISFFIPKLKEIKHKKVIGRVKGFEHLVLNEAKNALVEDIHEISSIPGYIKEK